MGTTNLLWYAKQAKVFINGAIADAEFTSSTGLTVKDLLSVSKLNYTGQAKDIRISGASRDLTAVNTCGEGQLKQPGRPDIVTAEFTLVYSDNDSAEFLAGAAESTAITSTSVGTQSGPFTRYKFGEKTTAALDRVAKAVLFEVNNQEATTSADYKAIYHLLNNADCTNREISLNADGHVEERLTFKCLAEDLYEDDNFTYLEDDTV